MPAHAASGIEARSDVFVLSPGLVEGREGKNREGRLEENRANDFTERIPARISNTYCMTRGFTCGAFDLCHAGHMLMFKECKEYCDYLIVGLQTDPSLDRPEKNKPILSLEERRIMLEGIKYIDEVVTYEREEDLYNLLKENALKIDVRIVGADWKDKPFTGHDLPMKVIFNTRDHGYSTSDIRKRVCDVELGNK